MSKTFMERLSKGYIFYLFLIEFPHPANFYILLLTLTFQKTMLYNNALKNMSGQGTLGTLIVCQHTVRLLKAQINLNIRGRILLDKVWFYNIRITINTFRCERAIGVFIT